MTILDISYACYLKYFEFTCEISAGDRQGAIQEFRKVLQIEPKNSEAQVQLEHALAER